MIEKDVTWGIALRVWWAMFWRMIVMVYIPIIIVSVLLGMVIYWLALPQSSAGIIGAVVGFVMGLGGSIWVIKQVLTLKTKNFRITVVET